MEREAWLAAARRQESARQALDAATAEMAAADVAEFEAYRAVPDDQRDGGWDALPDDLLARIRGHCAGSGRAMALVCRAWLRAARRTTKRGVKIEHLGKGNPVPVLCGDVVLFRSALYDATTGAVLRNLDPPSSMLRSTDAMLSPDGTLVVVRRRGVAEWSRVRDPTRTVLARFDLMAALERANEEGDAAVETMSNAIGVACVGMYVDGDARRLFITSPDSAAVEVLAHKCRMDPIAFSRDGSALLLQRSSHTARKHVVTVVGRDGHRLRHVDLGDAWQNLAVRPTDGAFTLFLRGKTAAMNTGPWEGGGRAGARARAPPLLPAVGGGHPCVDRRRPILRVPRRWPRVRGARAPAGGTRAPVAHRDDRSDAGLRRARRLARDAGRAEGRRLLVLRVPVPAGRLLVRHTHAVGMTARNASHIAFMRARFSALRTKANEQTTSGWPPL